MEDAAITSNAANHDSLWRLGEILMQKGWLQWQELETALALQKNNNRPIGEILLHQGLISQDLLFEALAIQFGKKFVKLKRLKPQAVALQMVPKHFVYEHQVLPLVFDEGQLLLAIPDPLNVWPISMLGKMTGISDIATVLATPADIREAIEQYYGPEGFIF